MSQPINHWAGAAGYSKRPLVEKLGLHEGSNVVLYAPGGYVESLRLEPPVTVRRRLEPEADFIQAFYTDANRLMGDMAGLRRSLKPAGQLWLCWPKRTSALVGDLSENAVRSIGLAHGLVDVKVAAIDGDWSGLKFVFRLKDR